MYEILTTQGVGAPHPQIVQGSTLLLVSRSGEAVAALALVYHYIQLSLIEGTTYSFTAVVLIPYWASELPREPERAQIAKFYPQDF